MDKLPIPLDYGAPPPRDWNSFVVFALVIAAIIAVLLAIILPALSPA